MTEGFSGSEVVEDIEKSEEMRDFLFPGSMVAGGCQPAGRSLGKQIEPDRYVYEVWAENGYKLSAM